MLSDSPIQVAFGPVLGSPCWNVKPGQGAFITLEFGQPQIDFREPREATHAKSPRIKKLYARRGVTLRGEWHLWIYCCYWNFFLNGQFIGDSQSEKGIQNSVRELNGQKLIGVVANHLPGRSVFEFDLGGRLTTRPYDKPYETPSPQWMLFEPSGNVLTFRADGYYSSHPGSTPADQEEWHPLSTLPAV